MAGSSCQELPSCLGPHSLSTKCLTPPEASGHPCIPDPTFPHIIPGTVWGFGGALPGIWQLWAPTHYCKPLWTAPTLSSPSHRTVPSERTQAPPAELLGLSSLCLLEGLPDQGRSCTGHPTKCYPSTALLSTGASEKAPALLAPQSTWPGPPRRARLRSDCEGTVAPPMPSMHPAGN